MRYVSGMCLLMFVLLAATLAGQDQSVPMPQQPALPATAEENWVMKRYKIEHATSVYETWMAKRK